ncbi:hypothetical protein C0431_06675 [bacterium]|nr:hypothetical protein [bacterium]
MPIELVSQYLGCGRWLDGISNRPEFHLIRISTICNLLFSLVFNKIPSDLTISVKFERGCAVLADSFGSRFLGDAFDALSESNCGL